MINQGAWNELLEKSKADLLSKHELHQVIAAIKDPAVKADPYTLLHIIGRAMDASNEDLVASYLDCPGDPMLSRLASQILCNYWGLTSKYIDYIRKFLSGVDWDVDRDVRQATASIAGEFIRTTGDDDLPRSLLGIATNENELPEMRVTAISALARALGYSWDSMSAISTESGPDDEWYHHVLSQAFEKFLGQ